MERLTPEHGWNDACYDPWEICGIEKHCMRNCITPEPCKIPKMLYRLAEYEDTGLSPEEIKQKLKELQRYKQLEAKGRLIELPCKVGDKIYRIDTRYEEINECTVSGFSFMENGNSYVFCEYDEDEPFDAAEFGKTVFLTHKEVDHALKAVQA